MALVTSDEILKPAREGGYAVGAFNTSNLEISQAIFEAAAEMKAPVIVATSESAIKYAGFVNLFNMVKHLADYYGVKAALHLDHGKDIEVVVKCLRNGWTSVMIDASKEPYEQNVAITSEVVRIAHMAGVPVEAELGRLAGIEDAVNVAEKDAHLTDPDQAAEFVERTGCDFLAVAIGTSHGAYKFKGDPRIDHERLSQIAEKVSIPLVLHGASSVPKHVLERASKYGAKLPGAKGVPEEAIREAVSRGISKINIDTDLRLAFTGAVREILTEKPEVFDPRKIVGEAREAIKDVVRKKIQLFGSDGKAA
ncbi:MAG TPA: class II fructose-1,6-bisphosphate aldolase [Firmicutes bacterium]|nr:class II fructose-1,6-bisphosphate aldolase [Bacillota bacterium]